MKFAILFTNMNYAMLIFCCHLYYLQGVPRLMINLCVFICPLDFETPCMCLNVHCHLQGVQNLNDDFEMICI